MRTDKGELKPKYYLDVKDGIKLKDIIKEAGDKNITMRIVVVDPRVPEILKEVESDKPDEALSEDILNALCLVVNKRPELIKKILQGDIKIKAGRNPNNNYERDITSRG